MELGSHPAACTADHSHRRLDDELPLTASHLGGEDPEAVQIEQPGG
jgi:hypothetical protein